MKFAGKQVTRVSRPCYDKFHRCPGWAGGGMRFARVETCRDGYVRLYDEDGMLPLWKWRLAVCDNPDCTVLVLPYLVRWVDPAWLKYVIKDEVLRGWTG